MSSSPELGQIVFGNPTGDYGTTEWQDALVTALLNEIERVYWNKNQIEWQGYEDPELDGLEVRPYYWGDDEAKSELPNLKFGFSEQAIRWYKYPGRGQSCSVEFTPEQWIEWFERGLKEIRSNDVR